MTNNEYVEEVYKIEKYLIAFCNNYSKFKVDSKELIQELYLKLLLVDNIDRYTYDKIHINYNLVYTVLRNMIINKQKRKKYEFSIGDIFDIDILEDEYTDGDKYCIQMIHDEIDKLPVDTQSNKFYKGVLEIYYKKNISLRKFSKESKIGYHYLQPVIQDFKDKLKDKYK